MLKKWLTLHSLFDQVDNHEEENTMHSFFFILVENKIIKYEVSLVLV